MVMRRNGSNRWARNNNWQFNKRNSPSMLKLPHELNAVQVSILRRKGTRECYAMPNLVTADAKRILTCVGLT